MDHPALTVSNFMEHSIIFKRVISHQGLMKASIQSSCLICLFYSYFENMERICSTKFIPTQRDVLRARVRTQGVIETCFRHKDVIIR